MERICWATTDSTSMLIRLNSSKQPHAPDWKKRRGGRGGGEREEGEGEEVEEGRGREGGEGERGRGGARTP